MISTRTGAPACPGDRFRRADRRRRLNAADDRAPGRGAAITGIAASASGAGDRLATPGVDRLRGPALDFRDPAALLIPCSSTSSPAGGSAASCETRSAQHGGRQVRAGDFIRSIVPCGGGVGRDPAADRLRHPLRLRLVRLPRSRARPSQILQAIADTMLIVIGWVLDPPLGVFPLACVVGARAGVPRSAPSSYVLILSAIGMSSGSRPGRWPVRRTDRRSTSPGRWRRPGAGVQHPKLIAACRRCCARPKLGVPSPPRASPADGSGDLPRHRTRAESRCRDLHRYWFGIELTRCRCIRIAAGRPRRWARSAFRPGKLHHLDQRRSAWLWACRSSRWRC